MLYWVEHVATNARIGNRLILDNLDKKEYCKQPIRKTVAHLPCTGMIEHQMAISRFGG